MKPEIPFVLGFAVNPSITEVLLIEKQHGPSFNIGKWNGLGGKIELGEGPRSAMAREFGEECGIHTEPVDWTCFHQEAHRARKEQTLNPRIYCMTIVLTNSEFSTYRTTTDETVRPFQIAELGWVRGHPNVVYNLEYLLAMVKCWHKHPEHNWVEG